MNAAQTDARHQAFELLVKRELFESNNVNHGQLIETISQLWLIGNIPSMTPHSAQDYLDAM